MPVRPPAPLPYRVKGSHAVDGVGADDGEVGHADALRGALANDGQLLEHLHVTGELALHLLEEPVVDVVNDRHVPREQRLYFY